MSPASTTPTSRASTSSPIMMFCACCTRCASCVLEASATARMASPRAVSSPSMRLAAPCRSVSMRSNPSPSCRSSRISARSFTNWSRLAFTLATRSCKPSPSRLATVSCNSCARVAEAAISSFRRENSGSRLARRPSCSTETASSRVDIMARSRLVCTTVAHCCATDRLWPSCCRRRFSSPMRLSCQPALRPMASVISNTSAKPASSRWPIRRNAQRPPPAPAGKVGRDGVAGGVDLGIG